MNPKTILLMALGAASIALPAAAQSWYGGGYDRPGYGWGHGDYYGGGWRDRGDWRFPGYPEFRGAEDHIRREIWDALRERSIDRDDARDMMARLDGVRAEEAREFQVHGWNLPWDDRARIRAQLDQLDRMADRLGDER